MNQPLQRPGLTPALHVLPDMPAIWQDLDLDFDSAAERLVRRHDADGASRDLPIMDLRLWAVKNGAGRFALVPLAGHEPERPLRSTAFSQLASRLGAPAEFVRDKLPAELQLATLNYLLAATDRPLSTQLRLRGEEVSAIVSERYAPLDAEAFVEALRSALVDHGVLDAVRVRALTTGPIDHLRLVLPGEQATVKVGDVSHLGLDVTTSSFARSSIHVSGMVWRLVCTNGLRAPSSMGSFSFRHVGESQRLRDGLRDAVPTALAHSRGVMGRWRAAVGTYIDEVASVIDGLRELSVGERALVGEELRQEAQVKELPERVSVYDLVNAITASAHAAEPLRRLEVEEVAGTVLHRHVRAA